MQHQSCTKIRRMLVTHSTLDMATGNVTTEGRKEWVTKPCGIPLFHPDNRKTGICRSCSKGWTHPENYPIEGE